MCRMVPCSLNSSVANTLRHQHAASPTRCATNTRCHQHAVPPTRCATNMLCYQHPASLTRCATNTLCHQHAVPPTRGATNTWCFLLRIHHYLSYRNLKLITFTTAQSVVSKSLYKQNLCPVCTGLNDMTSVLLYIIIDLSIQLDNKHVIILYISIVLFLRHK